MLYIIYNNDNMNNNGQLNQTKILIINNNQQINVQPYNNFSMNVIINLVSTKY